MVSCSSVRIAAWVSRMPFGGSGSSGSLSVLTGPPVRAYGQPANDVAISSVSGAAAIRFSVPSVRSRFVTSNWLSILPSFDAAQRGHLVDDHVGVGLVDRRA